MLITVHNYVYGLDNISNDADNCLSLSCSVTVSIVQSLLLPLLESQYLRSSL